MKSFLKIIVLSSILVILSCSDRERNNPLDPKNPETSGRIENFSVLSFGKSVKLGWSYLDFRGIDSISVYRLIAPGTIFTQISTVQPGQNSFTDYNVEYGTSYDYYITAHIKDYETPPTDTLDIEPGPTYSWILDYQSGTLHRMTHDLQYPIFSFGSFSYPILMHTSVLERAAWVYSDISNSLYKISENGIYTHVVYNLDQVNDFVIDQRNGNFFTIQKSQGLIKKFDASGTQLMEFNFIPKPCFIDMDQRRQDLWVVDEQSLSLFRISSVGQIRRQSEPLFTDPSDIVYCEENQVIWAADANRILVFDLYANNINTISGDFTWIRKLACDQKTGSVWAIEYNSLNSKYNVTKYSENGFLLSKNEFLHPVSIAVNEFDNSCLVCDDVQGKVFKISEFGHIEKSFDNIASPYQIEVEHHLE